jgi:hypothetical protein
VRCTYRLPQTTAHPNHEQVARSALRSANALAKNGKNERYRVSWRRAVLVSRPRPVACRLSPASPQESRVHKRGRVEWRKWEIGLEQDSRCVTQVEGRRGPSSCDKAEDRMQFFLLNTYINVRLVVTSGDYALWVEYLLYTCAELKIKCNKVRGSQSITSNRLLLCEVRSSMTSESPKPATHTRHEVRFTTLTVCNKNTTVSDTQITCKDIKLLMVKAIKVIFRFKGHSTLRKVSEGLSFSLRPWKWHRTRQLEWWW